MQSPKYFYQSENFETYFTDIELENVEFSVEIKLKEYNNMITVCREKVSYPYEFKGRKILKPDLSVYKSNLQKCVRRGEVDNACITAYRMLASFPDELLRRLPIIAIEDVLPFTSIGTIIWFMMAVSKGYILSERDVQYIIGFVCMISEYPEFEFFDSRDGIDVDLSLITQKTYDWFWAMEMRRAYGGMSCDMRMIKNRQKRWLERGDISKLEEVDFRLKPKIGTFACNTKVDLIDLESVITDESCIILEGIDYHPYPWILKKMLERFPFSKDELKIAIWYERSRINFRKLIQESAPIKRSPIGKRSKVIMKTIQKDLDGLCGWILERIIYS